MTKSRWMNFILISSIVIAIIAMFYFFPSIYDKAVFDTNQTYASSIEKDNILSFFINTSNDENSVFLTLHPYISSSIFRISTFICLTLFFVSIIIPYKYAIHAKIYRLFTDKVPYEITWVITLVLFIFYVLFSSKTIFLMFHHSFPFTIDLLSQTTWQVAGANLIQLLYLSILFTFTAGSAYSIHSMFHNGLCLSLQQHSFLLKNSLLIKRKLKDFIHYLIELKPQDKFDKKLFITLILHYFAIILCCLFWGNGIWSLIFIIFYCILIYIFQYYKNKRVRKDYQTLSQILQRVATGDFKTSIDSHLGIYEPLKDNLQNIESSFQEAVTQEIRSQNMRTELITNISHDLKTPLTSMISYIDLLKRKDITPEEKQHYIQILDKSSNRLKHLIEDIFEISKATSGNIQLEYMQIDIISLIKQVEMEYESLWKAHDLIIRNTFSNNKIICELDPQKTFRILENLFVNAGKYAMHHTRIYVHIEEKENTVFLSLKNISAIELNFDPDTIIERFQRADASRNTEGSGLGLAIAKSFTELQKGTMEIIFDADLFTVNLTFPKTQQTH